VWTPRFSTYLTDFLEEGDNGRADAGVSDQTIYTWRKQELIDTGVEPGLAREEAAELAAARRRIAELETELAATGRANELLKAQVPSPKGGSKRSG
jgi:transposase-like protein